MARPPQRAFLKAEWRNLVMFNYAVDPALLRPFVPRGTELDAWQGQYFVSLVGFLFAKTRVLGIPVPWRRAMRHHFGALRSNGVPSTVQYQWRASSQWTSLTAAPGSEGKLPTTGSADEFITHHYWGYTPQRDGSTMEYRVEHPAWRVWPVPEPRLEGDLAAVYGPAMSRVLGGAPASALLANGSPVAVFLPTKLGD